MLGLTSVCEPILRSVPEWLGQEQTNLQYLRDIDVNPTAIVTSGDKAIGFLSLLEHNQFSAEINIMAVHRDYHRQGAGKLLMDVTEEDLRAKGVRFLQVKTLSDKHPDWRYKNTRAFYMAVGFVPLQEFPELWNAQNPCLQLVKAL